MFLHIYEDHQTVNRRRAQIMQDDWRLMCPYNETFKHLSDSAAYLGILIIVAVAIGFFRGIFIYLCGYTFKQRGLIENKTTEC